MSTPVPSPDAEPMHDIVVSIPSRFLRKPDDPDVDLFDRIADVAYAWEAEQGDRDGWDVLICAGPSLEDQLAVVTRERDELAAKIERVKALCDEWEANPLNRVITPWVRAALAGDGDTDE